MKNIKKLIPILLVLVFISGCSSGCKIYEEEASTDMAYETSYDDSDSFGITNSFDGDMGVNSGVEVKESINREIEAEDIQESSKSKVITNVSMDMETTVFDESILKLETIIKRYNGFISKSNISVNPNYYSYDKSYKVADYIVRIPQESLDKFLNETGDVAKTISKNTTRDDVSQYYSDTESKLNVLEVKEERMLEMMKKAIEMEDLIILENTLSDTIYEKESLVKSLKGIDDKVSYSTVSLYIKEVERVSNIETIETSFIEKMTNSFNRSINEMKRFGESLLLNITFILPWFIVIILVLSLILYLTKKTIKKRKKNDI